MYFISIDQVTRVLYFTFDFAVACWAAVHFFQQGGGMRISIVQCIVQFLVFLITNKGYVDPCRLCGFMSIQDLDQLQT